MPSPLISCLEVKERLGEVEECGRPRGLDLELRRRMEQEITTRGFGEANVLSQLIPVPANLHPAHRNRIASYALRS